jgi:hypothetical protein
LAAAAAGLRWAHGSSMRTVIVTAIVFWLVIGIVDVPVVLLARLLFRRGDEADRRRLVP